ncbi:hypothetical protein FZD47_21050 [Bacillus infantis]|uniref:ABC transporter permease n=1 Tax=Bacillus infantis TaxID=324767 RepID=A0A5D4SES3_9BACI|nr:hypothetical protein [Bacillus infantis]TYS60698.1 hypothetical protein FZD47_21050 [Bacillus infantis]
MESSTVKALSFGAALFLVLALIMLAVNVFSPATEAAKSATTDFSATTTELKDQKYLIFDNTTISGSQVVNALRKFSSEAEAGNIGIRVKTGRGSDTWYFNTVSNNGDTLTPAGKPENVNTSTRTEYINPSGMFKATIIRDSNSVVRAVEFIQN